MKMKTAASPSQTPIRGLLLRYAVAVLFLALAAWFIYKNAGTVSQGIRQVRHAHPGWLLLGCLSAVATYLIAARIYMLLALRKLRYGPTLIIEVASACVNRLLPAGIGGLGLHGRYLYVCKHTTAGAATVVSMNNLIGMTAHLSLLAATFLLFSDDAARLHFNISGFKWYYLLPVLLVILVLLVGPLRSRLSAGVQAVRLSLRQYSARKLLVPYCSAILLTICYTLVLWASLRAVGGENVSLVHTFIVFSIGTLLGTVSPTPGGLVGAEAGLYGGFVGFGVSPVTAAAATLLYRLLTYWLPFLPGCLALVLARRKHLV